MYYNEDCKRRIGESLNEYKIRLCKNKSLYDLTFTDIAKLYSQESGRNMNPSSMQKFWQIFNEGYQNALKEIDDNSFQEKFEELQIEKNKLQDQKREYRKFLREYSRAEHLIETMYEVVDSISQIKPLSFPEKNNNIYNERYEGLLQLSDWHYGLEFDHYFGRYNTDICRERVNELIKKVIDYGLFYKITNLHVWLGGDLISGSINMSTRVMQEEDTISQVMDVSEILSEVLSELSSIFQNIYIYSVNDNHSRILPNKNESINKENFCRLIPWYLQSRLKDFENIKIMENKIDDDISLIKIFDNNIIGVHGHRDTLSKANTELPLMVKDIGVNYVLMAHLHHHYEKSDYGIEVIVNRCLSGTDEYAKNIRKTDTPGQKFMVFNKDVDDLIVHDIKFDPYKY